MGGGEPIPRPSARILLLNEGRVLLLRAVGFPDGGDRWITPGGGLKPGESFEEAAVRELQEETGLRDGVLGPCVWVRTQVFAFRDSGGPQRLYESRERFYVVRANDVPLSRDSWEDHEHAFLVEYRWWSPAEIAASSDLFVPAAIASLLPPIIAGDYPDPPADAGP